ncbi:hypothetical protein AMK16_32435 [Streptomyces sp. CB00455]|uniref:hypothetical protein n=1 Tax=Streptomyces sp. CB00455 TaxID=1703927 RepID=UPI00093BD4CA|nr:hypothetical protein [Streptomyces sp. CB00455]OKK12250.1 hypothetical protein AMK16_32435 [Streptomyces sp. CB00455]
MNTWEKRLADAAVREPRRTFDVAAGLRALAEEAGYVQPAPEVRRASRARRNLDTLSRLTLNQVGASSHVRDLTAIIGDPMAPGFAGWTEDVDIDGVQVFACALHLASHSESARFWWQLAAGAGHSGAAYCLYLHHLGGGDLREARFWKRQMDKLFTDSSSEKFIEVLESFAGYTARHRDLAPVPTGSLAAEFDRLAEQHDDGGLICRPDTQLADRIQNLAGRR